MHQSGQPSLESTDERERDARHRFQLFPRFAIHELSGAFLSHQFPMRVRRVDCFRPPTPLRLDHDGSAKKCINGLSVSSDGTPDSVGVALLAARHMKQSDRPPASARFTVSVALRGMEW